MKTLQILIISFLTLFVTACSFHSRTGNELVSSSSRSNPFLEDLSNLGGSIGGANQSVQDLLNNANGLHIKVGIFLANPTQVVAAPDANDTANQLYALVLETIILINEALIDNNCTGVISPPISQDCTVLEAVLNLLVADKMALEAFIGINSNGGANLTCKDYVQQLLAAAQMNFGTNLTDACPIKQQAYDSVCLGNGAGSSAMAIVCGQAAKNCYLSMCPGFQL